MATHNFDLVKDLGMVPRGNFITNCITRSVRASSIFTKSQLLAFTFLSVFAGIPDPLWAQMYGVGSGVGTNGSTLYRVDNFSTTPVRVNIADTGLPLSDIALTPNGDAYALTTNSELYQINLDDGSLEFLFNVAPVKTPLRP